MSATVQIISRPAGQGQAPSNFVIPKVAQGVLAFAADADASQVPRTE
jgi:hypothetical protein